MYHSNVIQNNENVDIKYGSTRQNWPPRYNWNIVKRVTKHHASKESHAICMVGSPITK
jgi:hypothetical protein